MKQLIALLTFSFIFSLSFAQVQRQKKAIASNDSSIVNSAQKADTGLNKREMMKELNLTREQKLKIKAFRQDTQAKKEAIENDTSLKPEEKQVKLKELRREQMKNTMSVLSPDQKTKLLQMRKALYRGVGSGKTDTQWRATWRAAKGK